MWTHGATVRDAYWIGGGQWAGKTTVAGLLADRHGLVHYHCDYHDARGHEDRRIAARARRGEPPIDWTAYWTGLTPREMADFALGSFAERFPWVLDDLCALASPHPVLADGWNLRLDLVADAVERATALGIRVVEVDGSRAAEAIADEVAAYWGL